jgi:hypothetical protein
MKLLFISIFAIVLFISTHTSASQFNSIDAAVYNADRDVYYFFSGGSYLRKKKGENVEGPFLMATNWPGWLGLTWSKMDAAVYNNDTDTYYFFNGASYARKKLNQPIEGPFDIAQNWEGFPTEAFKTIPHHSRDENNNRVHERVKKILSEDWLDRRGISAVAYNSEHEAYYFIKKNYYAIKPKGIRFLGIYSSTYGRNLPSVPLLSTISPQANKSFIVKTKDVDENATSTKFVNSLLLALSKGTKDSFLYDTYERRKIFYPAYGDIWPSTWKTAPQTAMTVGAYVFNADTRKWYLFTVNQNTKELEYIGWKDGDSQPATVKGMKKFASNWPL